MNLDCFRDCMPRQRKIHLARELNKTSSSLRESVKGRLSGQDSRFESTQHSIMKHLQVDELELLLEAVKSKGRAHNQCIYLTQRASSASKDSTMGVVSFAACKAWRWPDLTREDALKPLPNCQIPEENGDGTQSTRICINPYHWCKVIDVISDLKPSNSQSLICLRDDKALSSTEYTYNDSSEAEMRLGNWCHIAYWELTQRVGQLFPVTPSSIDIFQDMRQGCGVSLDALHKAHPAKTSSISSVRSKIGAGITLSNEGDLVWLYNRSQTDVFVTSYCLNLDKKEGEIWRVCKVAAGHSIIIYNYSLLISTYSGSTTSRGPSDPHSVHLSFVKGWSGSYSRQDILSCECRLDILVNKRWFEDT